MQATRGSGIQIFENGHTAAANLVKPGGRLIYATCSLTAEEDEEVAAAMQRHKEAR